MKNNQYLMVDDLKKILGRSQSHCYGIIRDLNKELKDKGYHVERGRVPRKYFYERYGLEESIEN